ncbi:hypothetical protein F5Y18DRAFT_394024 [Xylariaceae sp. FL1019]|nr:hypothetical protein F5Y18DRAFT_394024 [Xylariaceae sp. FL1019]
MPSILCCGLRHSPPPGNGNGQSKTNVATKNGSTEKVRPQSIQSVGKNPLVVAVPATVSQAGKSSAVPLHAQQDPHGPTIPKSCSPQIKLSLWEKAIETLSGEERSWIAQATDNTSMSVNGVVHQIIDITTTRQKHCAEKGWKTFEFGSHTISFADSARKALIWLNKFKEIGDIIVQYDPVHAALPWAAVRFVLQVLVTTEEQMAASFAVLEEATRIVHRCQVYEELYNCTTLNHNIVENLESALIQLYASILQGLFDIFKFLERRTPVNIMFAATNPNSIVSLLAKLEKGEQRVKKEVDACESQRMAKADGAIQNQLSGLLNLTVPILRVDENVNRILQRLERDELSQILEWISPIEHKSYHDVISEKRTNGTCDWLLRCAEYGQWSTSKSSITLWLRGLPGSGKTFLTSRVVDEMKENLGECKNDESIAFFYCKRNEENRQTALNVLRSYVRQLSTTPQMENCCHPDLREFHANSKIKGSGWTLGLCQQYLIKLLSCYPCTTLVLDALDECRSEEREILLNFFDSVPRQTEKPVKIFISSRPEGDIRVRLLHLPSIEILATDNADDIATYIRQSMKTRKGRWSKPLEDLQLRHDIENALITKNNGMFQWAKTQINQLVGLASKRDIEDRLGKLPDDLEAAYDEIFANIELLGPYASQMSFRALQWIICASQPLTDEALLAAIGVDQQAETIEWHHQIDAEDLLDWCGNLLQRDSQGGMTVWRVSHLSVVEYFEKRWALSEAHCSVAKACLLLLLDTYENKHGHRSESGDVDVYHEDHDLLIYVRYHWIRHVLKQEADDTDASLVRLLKVFLGSMDEPSQSYRAWHGRMRDWIFTRERNHYFRSGKFFEAWNLERLSPPTTPAFLVCLFGIYSPLRDWWETTSFNALQVNEYGNSLLSLAAAANSKQICLKLCQLGVPVNAAETQTINHKRSYGSALGAAVLHNHREIVELLVEQGADVNLPLLRQEGSALAIAISLDRFELAEFLIEHGANVNLRSNSIHHKNRGCRPGSRYFRRRARETPFEYSLHSIRWVHYLVERGADINMQLRNGYGSALATVAGIAHHCLDGDADPDSDVLSFLIDNGAYVDMQIEKGPFGSALGAAAARYAFDNVQILVNAGAEVNMQIKGGIYGSALAAAASTTSLEMIRFLIAHGAVVDMPIKNGAFGSALVASSLHGRLEVVRLLVENGADVNMRPQSGDYGSALAAAASRGHLDVARFLLEQGADVNSMLNVGWYGSALAAAAARHATAEVSLQVIRQYRHFTPVEVSLQVSLEVIELLVEKGADVNQQLLAGAFGSALAAAACSTHKSSEIVEYLVENGADINMQLQGGMFGSALMAAAAVRDRSVEVVSYLIGKGADINMKVRRRVVADALSAAVHTSNSLHIIQMLIDYGATLDALYVTVAKEKEPKSIEGEGSESMKEEEFKSILDFAEDLAHGKSKVEWVREAVTGTAWLYPLDKKWSIFDIHRTHETGWCMANNGEWMFFDISSYRETRWDRAGVVKQLIDNGAKRGCELIAQQRDGNNRKTPDVSNEFL